MKLNKENINLDRLSNKEKDELILSLLNDNKIEPKRIKEIEIEHKKEIESYKEQQKKEFEAYKEKHESKFEAYKEKYESKLLAIKNEGEKKLKELKQKLEIEISKVNTKLLEVLGINNDLIIQLNVQKRNRFGMKSEKAKENTVINEAEATVDVPVTDKKIKEFLNTLEGSVLVEEKITQIENGKNEGIEKEQSKRKEKKKTFYILGQNFNLSNIRVHYVGKIVLEKKPNAKVILPYTLKIETVKEHKIIHIFVPKETKISEKTSLGQLISNIDEKNIGTNEKNLNVNPLDIFGCTCLTPSFASEICVTKLLYGIPLYRMEKKYAAEGLEISRQTLSNYYIAAANVLKPIYDLITNKLISSEAKIIQADETYLKVIEEKRSKCYMWVYVSCIYEHLVGIYKFATGRGAEHPKEFLKDFKGYLVCDAYAGYNSIPNVTLVRCWVHARRPFYELTELKGDIKPPEAMKIVGMIDNMFHIDKEIRNKKETNVEIIKKDRDILIQPLINEYFSYIKDILKKNPNSILKKAINYSINAEEHLKNFLLDGHLPMDNNNSERIIRDFAIGRKNYLFSNTVNGANMTAILMTVIQTARMNGLEPTSYLEYLFNNIQKTKDLNDLLPWSASIPGDIKIKIASFDKNASPNLRT